MRNLLYFLVAVIALCFSCNGNGEQTAEAQQDSIDSVIQDSILTDSLDVVGQQLQNKRVDEFFDDFIFGFMKSRRQQLARIDFPLRHTVDGKTSYITRKQWRYDPMYSNQEVYTLVFADKRAMQVAKDTSLRNVIVEKLDIVRHYVWQYTFKRPKDQWRLQAIDAHTFDQSADRDFYNFYERFATDEAYQKQHIASSFAFSTFDDENFERVEGTLEAVQWEDFRPELPTGEITNIIYGKKQRGSNTRILSICGLSDGMSCNLTFKKRNGEWVLTQLDN
ncbi:MAG: DUF4348 domain-containing protein [Bacteroidales bacterium]|nr:DUF4348 domain-containing protein [Candidatus Equimonas enterica]